MLKIPNLVVKSRQTMTVNKPDDFNSINIVMEYIRQSKCVCARVNVTKKKTFRDRLSNVFKHDDKKDCVATLNLATEIVDILVSLENMNDFKSLALLLLNEANIVLRFTGDNIETLGSLKTTEMKINRYLNAKIRLGCPLEILQFLKNTTEEKDVLGLTP